MSVPAENHRLSDSLHCAIWEKNVMINFLFLATFALFTPAGSEDFCKCYSLGIPHGVFSTSSIWPLFHPNQCHCCSTKYLFCGETHHPPLSPPQKYKLIPKTFGNMFIFTNHPVLVSSRLRWLDDESLLDFFDDSSPGFLDSPLFDFLFHKKTPNTIKRRTRTTARAIMTRLQNIWLFEMKMEMSSRNGWLSVQGLYLGSRPLLGPCPFQYGSHKQKHEGCS